MRAKLQCLSRPHQIHSPLSSTALRVSTLAPTSINSKSPSTRNPRLKQAFFEMAVLGFSAKFQEYDTMLTQCINLRSFRDGQLVHAHMIKTDYKPQVYLGTRLIVFYSKCDCLIDAQMVFDEMPERNVVSWTAMISAYSKRECGFEALSLLVQMLRSGVFANEFTFATVLTMCAGASGFHTGKQVHSIIIKSNCEQHIFVGCSLLDMYAKAGRIQEARSIFESLPERDVVSCTAMIAGYAQLGLDEQAISMFRRLCSDGMCSNYVTFASVLTALSGLAALEYGKQVHGHILRLELPFYVVLQNSLIDMYSKCGKSFYSRKIFDSMPDRTTVSWNAMLVCYSKHGMGREAVELFRLMKEDSIVKPDEITLLAVLSGCSHGGMQARGVDIFDEMVNGKYEIAPQIEHYACIVDMLGRAGLVEKAFQFIQQMPFQPTAAILGSMLGACRVHSNVNIGQLVGHQLLEIEPENAGNYVILSNLYASSGRWEDVRHLRELMTEKAVTKEPGRSWIELEQTLHTFHAADQSHPKKKELIAKVKDLAVKFGGAGYVPDLSCVLHDVDDEQKEKILLGHSEKLALAFGLLNTREGVSLRVIKNLRICVDCHSFAKFISKVYGRDVSLRDKNRFHHIVEGVCSCGDYW